MEIHGISSSGERTTSVWTELARAAAHEQQTETAGDAAAARTVQRPETGVPVREGFVERILGETHEDVTAAPARPAGTHADHGPESANVQIYGRTPVPAPEPTRGADAAVVAAAHAERDFALPASLLVPATLVGLQVERAEGWPLPQPAFVPSAARPLTRVERDRQEKDEQPQPQSQEPADHAAGEGGEGDEAPHAEPAPSAPSFEAGTQEDWSEALTRALREALAARIVPQPLLAAAEQWRRGRCVVLACPQGIDPAGPAWAFVLWPRPRKPVSFRGADAAAPLALFGLRVEARLQWSSPHRSAHWCHVRVVKEHHPRRGRQLIAAEHPAADGKALPPACEVQLGPVLARSLHWCEVCVHIHAAQRFWAALGQQWSVHVVVCSQPLTAVRG